MTFNEMREAAAICAFALALPIGGVTAGEVPPDPMHRYLQELEARMEAEEAEAPPEPFDPSELEQRLNDAGTERDAIRQRLDALESDTTDTTDTSDSTTDGSTTDGSAATFTVSNASQLRAALESASGGDEILLESGSYGSFDFNGVNFDDFVTIRSADGARGARFGELDFDNSSHIRVDNVEVYASDELSLNSSFGLVSVDSGSDHIEVRDSEVHSFVPSTPLGGRGLYAGDATNVVFADNDVHHIGKGGVFIGASGLSIVGNEFDVLRNDTMQLSGVDDVLIENNTGARQYFGQSGDHQDFIQFTGSDSSDVTIRGNVSLLDNAANIQGIFLDDANFTNITVDNNLISTGMGRGITISSGTGNVVHNNTVLHIAGTTGSKASWIGGALSARFDNIYVNWNKSSENLVIDISGDDAYNYSTYFQSVPDGGKLGLTVADFAPVAGSPAETMGAYQRVADILSQQ